VKLLLRAFSFLSGSGSDYTAGTERHRRCDHFPDPQGGIYLMHMHTKELMIGACAGSALMFMLDPNGGQRRRALIRDKAVRASRKTRDGLGATARDLSNRAAGVAASTTGRWSSEEVDDEVLVARVRAKLGRVTTHPHAISVEAADGRVTLRGPILAAELANVLSATASVRGVKAVNSALEQHATNEGVPSLQGEGRLAGPSLNPRGWSPTTRALVGASAIAAGALMAMRARTNGGWTHA
jgi:hypothetical protein